MGNIHIFNKSPFCFECTIGKVSKSSPTPFHVLEPEFTATWNAMTWCTSEGDAELGGHRYLSGMLTRWTIMCTASWTSCECFVQFSSHSVTSSSIWGGVAWLLKFTRRSRETALGYCVAMLTPDHMATSPPCSRPVRPGSRCLGSLGRGGRAGVSLALGDSLSAVGLIETVNVGWLDTPGGFLRLHRGDMSC